jgi:hypothetical protein
VEDLPPVISQRADDLPPKGGLIHRYLADYIQVKDLAFNPLCTFYTPGGLLSAGADQIIETPQSPGNNNIHFTFLYYFCKPTFEKNEDS